MAVGKSSPEAMREMIKVSEVGGFFYPGFSFPSSSTSHCSIPNFPSTALFFFLRSPPSQLPPGPTRPLEAQTLGPQAAPGSRKPPTTAGRGACEGLRTFAPPRCPAPLPARQAVASIHLRSCPALSSPRWLAWAGRTRWHMGTHPPAAPLRSMPLPAAVSADTCPPRPPRSLPGWADPSRLSARV